MGSTACVVQGKLSSCTYNNRTKLLLSLCPLYYKGKRKGSNFLFPLTFHPFSLF
uniref:Uncharacterized protein n=1 Tax=Arundo donax TaxID=35708 RepID=A0A0A9STH2_ARUDO